MNKLRAAALGAFLVFTAPGTAGGGEPTEEKADKLTCDDVAERQEALQSLVESSDLDWLPL